MPNSIEETQILADQILTDNISNINTRQTAYYSGYGVYFQGLDIAIPYPTNGELSIPDFGRTPTDQVSTWNPVDFPAYVPASLSIDVYNGEVIGYVCVLSFIYTDKLYQKRVGFDGTLYLSHDWLELDI